LCSHEAITDVSLTGGREEFTGYLRERGIVRKDLICCAWVAPLCSHEAVEDASFAASPAVATKSRFFATLRSALQKVDELLLPVEQFRPSGPESFLPAFCAPRTSSVLSSLDPRRGSIE